MRQCITKTRKRGTHALSERAKWSYRDKSKWHLVALDSESMAPLIP